MHVVSPVKPLPDLTGKINPQLAREYVHWLRECEVDVDPDWAHIYQLLDAPYTRFDCSKLCRHQVPEVLRKRLPAWCETHLDPNLSDPVENRQFYACDLMGESEANFLAPVFGDRIVRSLHDDENYRMICLGGKRDFRSMRPFWVRAFPFMPVFCKASSVSRQRYWDVDMKKSSFPVRSAAEEDVFECAGVWQIAKKRPKQYGCYLNWKDLPKLQDLSERFVAAWKEAFLSASVRAFILNFLVAEFDAHVYNLPEVVEVENPKPD